MIVAEKKLKWLVSKLSHFYPHNSKDYRESEERYKMCLELACLCMIYKEHHLTNKYLEICLEYIDNIYSDDVVYEKVVRHPEKFRLHGLTVVALAKSIGKADTTYKHILKITEKSDYITGREENPFRELEIIQTFEWAGIKKASARELSEVYNRTLLGRTKNLIQFSDVDTYIATHIIFYLSDFGKRDLKPILSQPEITELIDLFNNLIVVYLYKKDCDILAELVISLMCLGIRKGYFFSLGKEFVDKNSREDGSIVGPKFQETAMNKLPEIDRDFYYVKHNYHTTIVAALSETIYQKNLTE